MTGGDNISTIDIAAQITLAMIENGDIKYDKTAYSEYEQIQKANEFNAEQVNVVFNLILKNLNSRT